MLKKNAYHLFDKMPKKTVYFLSFKIFFTDMINMCQRIIPRQLAFLERTWCLLAMGDMGLKLKLMCKIEKKNESYKIK